MSCFEDCGLTTPGAQDGICACKKHHQYVTMGAKVIMCAWLVVHRMTSLQDPPWPPVVAHVMNSFWSLNKIHEVAHLHMFPMVARRGTRYICIPKAHVLRNIVHGHVAAVHSAPPPAMAPQTQGCLCESSSAGKVVMLTSSLPILGSFGSSLGGLGVTGGCGGRGMMLAVTMGLPTLFLTLILRSTAGCTEIRAGATE